MQTADLTFSAPNTLREALDELVDDEVTIMGGGTSVAMLLKNKLIEPRKILWVANVPDLRRLAVESDGSLRIGAMTTLRELAHSSAVEAQVPALATAAASVGNHRVRSVATLGGALAHADPRQDIPPVLLALDARVRAVRASNQRDISLSEFFTGFMDTVLDEREIITEVVVPPSPNRQAYYARYTPGSEDDYPTVGVAVSIQRGPDARITKATVAIGGVGPTCLLVPEAEGLSGKDVPSQGDIEAVAAGAEAAAEPADDQRGSVRYKKAMTGVWTRRALLACLTGEPSYPTAS